MGRHVACRAAAAAAATALSFAAACRRGDTSDRGGDAADSSAAGLAVQAVRAHYSASDVVAAGAWSWTASDSSLFVLVDAQSTVQDLVQARADLWMVRGSQAIQVGQSDVMSSAAEIGAYAFEDLTGDGIPDLFGYVADSAGVSYPVFLGGTRGAMTDAIASAAAGWRFSTEDDHLPAVLPGASGACALQLWAEDAAPDGQPPGWRYLALQRDGDLSAPRSTMPGCAVPPAGVQP